MDDVSASYVRFFYFTVSKVEQEVSLDQSAFRLLCKVCLVVVKHFLCISNNHSVYTAESFIVFAIQDQNVRNKESAFRHLRLNIERVISELSRDLQYNSTMQLTNYQQ